MQRIPALGVLLAAALALAGCSRVPFLPTVYKIDVRQGNYIDEALVASLEPGMTRSQVMHVMGTPPIADPFHAGRWDYVYAVHKAGKRLEQRGVTLHFDGERLARVDGDGAPR